MDLIEDRKYLRAIRPDLVAFDPDDKPVLIVEVKGVTPVPESVSQLLSYMDSAVPAVPFGMLADPKDIRIYQSGSPIPVAIIPTADILRHYVTAEFSRPVSSALLTTTIEAWLSDLDSHWHSEIPPAVREMTPIGLLPRLKSGTIEREVSLVCHPIH
ncbi:MAG TPA: hypothetical protein VG406_11860 [Isosphaeraceae bacterium]|jgi:hypothetical protein|nr:hypothetical protein [Isosphaeraceae bacterium]